MENCFLFIKGWKLTGNSELSQTFEKLNCSNKESQHPFYQH
jgi:hypothetical protein